MRVVVLPGMDGGADLSAAFRAELPSAIESLGVEYPVDEALGYDELEGLVRDELSRSSAPTVLLAESFSGPIAVRIGAAPPVNLIGVLLVASFVESPVPAALRHLVGSYLFWAPPPRALVRRFMLDDAASDAVLADVISAIGRVRPRVLAARARAIMTVDARAELGRITLPLRYLEARHDRLVAVREGLVRCRPDLDLQVIDAPHLVLASRPTAAARALEAFIGTIRSTE